MSDTSNYRPVAVATVVSKLLEKMSTSHYLASLLSLVPQTISFKWNVQGTNDANNMGQEFVWTVSCV